MKAEEDTQSLEYCRTTVPSSMRSPYWKYFGFPSDDANNILTKQKIICTLCNTAIAYNKNTSNLRTHLIAKHCQLLHELQLQHQQQQQSQHQQSNGKPSSKRNHSEISAASSTSHASAGNVPEKKVKDNKCIYSAESAGACIESTYSQNAFFGVVDEEEATGEGGNNDDIVELVESVHQTEDLSDLDGVAFANYATYHSIEDFGGSQQKEVATGDKIDRSDNDAYDAFIQLESEECPETTNSIRYKNDFNLENLVLDMIITDILPLSTIKGPGLTRLISQFGGFNKTTVELKLVNAYDKMYEQISKHLKHISETQLYSFSVESYKNVDKMWVTCVYVNYYCMENSKLLSILFENVIMPEEIAMSNQNPEFDNIFKDLNLSKCSAAMLKGSLTIVETFFKTHGIPIIPCLESVLSQCLSSIFELPIIKAEVNNIISIAVSAVPSVFTDSVTELYPLCPWSKLNFLQFCVENLKWDENISSLALDKIRELVNYICPLKITLETIADEPLPLCSLMRPFTVKLMDEHFSAYFTEEDCLYEVKQILIEGFTNSVLKNAFLCEATFFDGRFRRDFLTTEDTTAIKTNICERFKPTEDITVKSETNSPGYVGSANRKSNLKSFFQRTDESRKLNVTQKVMSNIEYEFNKYNCEPALDLDQCPINWWEENVYNFKELKQFADHYRNVPCYVNRLFKQNVNKRNGLQNKRFMLRQQNDQKIWYLNYNKKFYDFLNHDVH